MNKTKRNNLTIKIISIFIAIIMWSYVMSEVNPRITKDFPGIKVNYLNQSSLAEAGLEIMEPAEAKITVKVVGRRSDVNSINPNDIVAQVDLWGYAEGSNRVPVEVNVPDKVELESTNPSYIQFKFDGIITKEHKILLRTTGTAADGYTKGIGEARPSTVLIKGARSLVNSVSKVVATVDLSSVTADIKTSVPIRAIDDNGNEVRGIEKEPNTVEIFMPMLGTKNISVQPRTKGTPLNGFKLMGIQMNPSTVKIKGRGNILKDIEFIETEPIDIDLINLSKEIAVGIVLPEGVELMEEDIKLTAKIEVEKIIEKEIELDINRLTFINLDTQLSVDKSSLVDNIIITVRGTESKIEALSEKDITFYSDLSEIGEGAHNVGIKAIPPDEIELIEINPETIKLNIKNGF